MPDTANETENNVVVLDIPAETPADDAARLMNEPYARGFYIHRAMEHGLGSLRVVYVHRDKPAAPRSSVTKEATTIQFLRDNREMSISQLVATFKAIGFVRGAVWITDKRAEIIKADHRGLAEKGITCGHGVVAFFLDKVSIIDRRSTLMDQYETQQQFNALIEEWLRERGQYWICRSLSHWAGAEIHTDRMKFLSRQAMEAQRLAPRLSTEQVLINLRVCRNE